MVKKIATAAAGIGLILATAAPAFAGNISISNTGNGSNVTSRIDRVRQHVFTLQNMNTLNQVVNSSFATGGNSASNNTHDGMAVAGNASTNETSQIELNTSNVDIDVADNTTCNCADNVTVDWTGSSSNVTAITTDTRNVSVTITNTGSVNNLFTSSVSTGGNSANNNTGNGTAIGGDVWANHVITTKLNTLLLKLRM